MIFIENEIAFEFLKDPKNFNPTITALNSWKLNKSNYMIEDILLEREGSPLEDEKVGIRLRQQDNRYELTLKKFLGRENKIAKYFELNKPISKINCLKIKEGKTDKIKSLYLIKNFYINKLYPFLAIKNHRTKYEYILRKNRIIFYFERVIYKSKKQRYKEKLLEVEFMTDNNALKNEVIKQIQKKYQLKIVYEGKNIRAKRYLKL